MAEIVFTGSGDEAADRQVRRLAEADTLRRILPRVYTTNLRDPLEAIVRRNIWQILGRLQPGAVISARSAALAMPAYSKDAAGHDQTPGFIFLTGPSRRSLSLPGNGGADRRRSRPAAGRHSLSWPLSRLRTASSAGKFVADTRTLRHGAGPQPDRG